METMWSFRRTTSEKLSQERPRCRLPQLASTIQRKAMPSTKVSQFVPLPFFSGLTRGVLARSVRRLGMLFPCGLPEGKAVSLLPQGDDFIAGVRLCLCTLQLRQGAGTSVNHKRTHPPFPLCLRLRRSMDPVLSIASPSLAAFSKAMCRRDCKGETVY